MDPLLDEAEGRLKAGDHVRAEALCQEVLARTPGDADAVRLLAMLRIREGRAADAIPFIRRALDEQPESLAILDALSNAYMAVEDYARAETIVRRAIALNPAFTPAYMRLGAALGSQHKWAEAARVYEEAIACESHFAQARLGETHASTKLLADAHHNLGDALLKLFRIPEAIVFFRRAVALNPVSPESHNSLGYALEEIGLRDAAAARYRHALALDPRHAFARHNLGVVHLMRHEFERGWPSYDRRLEAPLIRAELRKEQATLALYQSLPQWKGSADTGASALAIWAEQGIGDQILYSTLIPELLNERCTITYEVDARLLAAYQRAFPAVRFVSMEDPPVEPLRLAERVLLAGSLPALFRTTRESFARQPDKMLSAMPEKVARYRAHLQAQRGGRVALSWKSKRAGGPGRGKTAPLGDFAPLLQLSGIQFVDVQYGDTGAERESLARATGTRLVHFDEVDYFNDLEDVIAILEACDLLITTSNATAHLAGALGKRTWLLYPGDNPPFHYWAPGADRRSLWYPSVEIISAPRLTTWSALAAEAAARLRAEISPRPALVESAAAASDATMEPAAHARLLREQGRLEEAAVHARRQLECAPRDAALWCELAHTLRWQGDAGQSRAAAERAVEIAPERAEAWFQLGAALTDSGAAAAGVEAYRKAVELKPDFAEAWSNLGGALGAAGDAQGEIDAYIRAVGANPALAPVWTNLGTALLEAGDVEAAVDACRRAVALNPDDAAAWSNVGNALREHGKLQEAVAACRRALELAPQLAEAWSNLGAALMEQAELEQSLSAHARALELSPQSPKVHYNLGVLEERRGRLPEAVAAYRGALALDPAFAAAGMRLACALLSGGSFAEGWPEYEWRWLEKGARPKRFESRPWRGEREPNGRLLLWGEQGLGDELIYAGMIGELAATQLKLQLEIDPRLVTLMQRSFPGVEVLARSDPPAIREESYDWQSPLGSLGRWLRPSFGAFPKHAGYLKPDPARVEAMAAHLRGTARAPIVGISWMSANREFGAQKSMALTDWAAILGVSGARFVDLQYGDTRDAREAARAAGLDVLHLDELDLYNDLEGLAAACAACDLVITASNVTAHMAGALGRPAWVLVPRGTGRIWYWFTGRADSPWYPSMRIYSQERPGRWHEPLAAIARDLAALVKAG